MISEGKFDIPLFFFIDKLYVEEVTFMYLYCYARSDRAKLTGQKLIDNAEGEWIDNLESFISSYAAGGQRADGTVVLLLHQEACVKLLLERLYPSDIKFPVINITPDGKYAGILRPGGYNTYQILDKVTSILGSTALSGEDDRKDTAPDLMRTVMSYQMKADDENLLKEITEFIKNGGTVDVYSDLPLEMSEPVLDSLSYRPFLFQSNQKNELNQAYASANSEDKYSVFITCARMADIPKNGKVLTLVPKIVVLGIEVSSRSDPDYSARTCREYIEKYHINPDAVVTVAVSALSKDSEAVRKIAEDLGCFVTYFDSRLLKAVRVPLNMGFTPERLDSDFCTAAACLASDNGRILMRRAGDRNSVIMTTSIKRSPVYLTH